VSVRGLLGEYTYTIDVERNRRDEAIIAGERVTTGDDVLYEARDGKIGLYGDRPTKVPRTQFDMRSERSFLPSLEARDDNRRLQDLRDAIASLWMMRTNPLAMSSSSRTEEVWLERDGSNFASWYRHVIQQRPAAGARLGGWLREVIPGFVQLRFEGVGGVRDLVVTFDRPGPYELRFDLLSDGQRALVLMHAVLAFIAPGGVGNAPGRVPTLVWDEPDNFVSLGEIQPWLAKVSDLVAEGEAQGIVISHHPEVIDYLAADTVLWFSRANGGPVQVSTLAVDRDAGLRASEWVARGLAETTGVPGA
jgi:predicted ATPase